MWAFLVSPLGRAGMALVAVLTLAAAIWGAGHHSAVKAQAARDAAAAAKIAQHEAVAANISTSTAADLAQTRERVVTVTKTLVQKVKVYVPAAADNRCVVPVGFVQLHDAAAAGVPGSAGGPVEAPSGVPLSAVAETVVANYGVAYDWRAEALGWRDWYVKQKAAWDKR